MRGRDESPGLFMALSLPNIKLDKEVAKVGDSPEEIPDKGALRRDYEDRRPGYERLLAAMEARLRVALEKKRLFPIVKGRIKSFESWYAKLIRILRNAKASGRDPIPITDIVALRVVCPFLGDLNLAENAIGSSFKVLDVERKGSDRSFREFGYESIHLLIELPSDLRDEALDFDRPAIEVQLRTILQEAWAEVEHELVYKAEFTPFDEPMKRKLAALNANLSLSDIIFQEILDYQRRLNSELERRRSSFYGKIEDVMDKPLEASLKGEARVERRSSNSDRPQSSSMDDLFLAALSAHNREDFEGASRIYGEILSLGPEKNIAAVVYKHRGMAYFSQSFYKEAIGDFTASLELDPKDYKAAYYRGVVKSVLQDFVGAAGDFDLALGIHPFHFFSIYRRAMAYWHLGDYAQALADSEAALKLEPGNEQAERLRDLTLRKMKM
jgi:putative GTP pyrophosphokinase